MSGLEVVALVSDDGKRLFVDVEAEAKRLLNEAKAALSIKLYED
jgi:hypothetical protein